MSKLAGKSIDDNGDAQGIGEGIARRLAADGASVAIADLKIDQAKRLGKPQGRGRQGDRRAGGRG